MSPVAAFAKFMTLTMIGRCSRVELLLRAVGAHPGAAALRGASEVIAEEEADMPAGRVLHLEDAHILMIGRDVEALAEAEAEEAMRACRNRLR